MLVRLVLRLAAWRAGNVGSHGELRNSRHVYSTNCITASCSFQTTQRLTPKCRMSRGNLWMNFTWTWKGVATPIDQKHARSRSGLITGIAGTAVTWPVFACPQRGIPSSNSRVVCSELAIVSCKMFYVLVKNWMCIFLYNKLFITRFLEITLIHFSSRLLVL